jgi:hypothetical protein
MSVVRIRKSTGWEDLSRVSASSVPIEPWHEVGAAGEPAFGGTWRSYNAGVGVFGKVGFRKTPDGKVQMRGLAESVTASGVGTIFTLPVGYRPTQQHVFLAVTSAGSGVFRIDVSTTGEVAGAVPAAGQWVSLAEIEFPTDQAEFPVGPQGPTRIIQRVTSLPANPADSDEVDFVADTANGVLWRLKYNAASASAYKWEFVGGTPLYAAVEPAQVSAAGTGWQDFTTVGPSLTLPLNGDYDFEYGAAIGDTPQQRCLYGPKIGAATALDADAVQSAGGPTTGSNDASVSRRKRFTAQVAATVIKMQYRNAISSTTASYEKRWLSIMPVRVG